MVSLISAPLSARPHPCPSQSCLEVVGLELLLGHPFPFGERITDPGPSYQRTLLYQYPSWGVGSASAYIPTYLTSRARAPQSKSSEMTVKLDFEECLKDSPRFR